MLGYIRASKPELTVLDYEIYRGVYCSLCRNLGRRYSPLAQLFLSFDFTFAALLFLAVRQEKCTLTPCRCPYNPAKRCSKCTDRSALDRCADGVIITVYHKLLDDIHDRGFFRRILALLLFPAVALMHRKAARLSPEIETAVSTAMTEQKAVENTAACVDAAADPSAKALSVIFSLGVPREEEPILRRFGYMVGRFIYIIDAADDIEKDIKRGNFNPLAEGIDSLTAETRCAIASRVDGMINSTLDEAAIALDMAGLNRFSSIIINVIYDGLPKVAQTVLERLRTGKKPAKGREEITV